MNENSSATSTALIHGFQHIRTMEHTVPSVYSVVYVPHAVMHLSLDISHMHMWKGY
jgi:hypothetical protein